jgi:hypothetical protein
MAETSKPAPRHFVEFHWGQDGDAIFSKGCRHSEDTGSAKFCHWLLDNTSWEFRARLPISILQCFGYGFPKDPAGDWAVYDGQFSHEYSKGNWLKMELASKGLPGTETALRLYVDSINRNFAPDELDPVTHMASADDGGVK